MRKLICLLFVLQVAVPFHDKWGVVAGYTVSKGHVTTSYGKDWVRWGSAVEHRYGRTDIYDEHGRPWRLRPIYTLDHTTRPASVP